MVMGVASTRPTSPARQGPRTAAPVYFLIRCSMDVAYCDWRTPRYSSSRYERKRVKRQAPRVLTDPLPRSFVRPAAADDRAHARDHLLEPGRTEVVIPASTLVMS